MPRLLLSDEHWLKLREILLHKAIYNKRDLRMTVEGMLYRMRKSLVGRMEVIYLNPLSEQEKRHSRHSLLESLLSDQLRPAFSGLQPPVAGVTEAVVRGCYPEPNARTEPRARQWFRQYFNAIIQRDVQDIANIRDGDELLRLLQLIGLRTGNLNNVSNRYRKSACSATPSGAT